MREQKHGGVNRVATNGDSIYPVFENARSPKVRVNWKFYHFRLYCSTPVKSVFGQKRKKYKILLQGDRPYDLGVKAVLLWLLGPNRAKNEVFGTQKSEYLPQKFFFGWDRLTFIPGYYIWGRRGIFQKSGLVGMDFQNNRGDHVVIFISVFVDFGPLPHPPGGSPPSVISYWTRVYA